MKIVNGSNKVLLLPLGNGMLTVLPKNVSTEIVATTSLVQAAIAVGSVNSLGLVTYSAAELQTINKVSGAAPFVHPDIDSALAALIPEGIKPIVEERIISAGETTAVRVGEDQGEAETHDTSALQSLKERLEAVNLEKETLESDKKSALQRAEAAEAKARDLQALLDTAKGEGDPEDKKKIQDLEATKKRLEDLLAESQNKEAAAVKELEEKKSQLAEKVRQVNELSESSTSSAELEAAQAETEKFKQLLSQTVKNNELVWDAEKKGYYPA